MSRLPGYCTIEGCERPRQGTLEVCASHAKLQRDEDTLKIEKPLTGLRRGSPPNKQSDKRREESKDYSKMRAEYLKENPVCEANLRVCTGNATEVHHRAKRGKNYLNKETFMSTCHECHVMIETVLSAEDRRNMGFLMTLTDKPTI